MKTNRVFSIIFSIMLFHSLNAISQNQNPTQNVCAGSTQNYYVTGAVGSTYAWSITPASGGTVVGTDDNININWGTTSGNYTVQVIETSSDGCAGNPKTVSVTVITAPTVSAGSNQNMCTQVGAIISLSNATASNYASLSWSAGTGTGTFNNNTLLNPTYTITAADLTAGSITFTLTATGNTPCANTSSNVTYTITSAPTLTVGNNGPVCENSALSLTSSNIVGATYSWTGPGFTSSQQNPSVSANATIAMAGTYNLTISNILGGCPNLTGSTTVIVNPKPTTSSIWHN